MATYTDIDETVEQKSTNDTQNDTALALFEAASATGNSAAHFATGLDADHLAGGYLPELALCGDDDKSLASAADAVNKIMGFAEKASKGAFKAPPVLGPVCETAGHAENYIKKGFGSMQDWSGEKGFSQPKAHGSAQGFRPFTGDFNPHVVKTVGLEDAKRNKIRDIDFKDLPKDVTNIRLETNGQTVIAREIGGQKRVYEGLEHYNVLGKMPTSRGTVKWHRK